MERKQVKIQKEEMLGEGKGVDKKLYWKYNSMMRL